MASKKEVQRTVGFKRKELGGLPDNKPVVYKILNGQGDNIYTGVAKRGRVEERLSEHLPGSRDPIPGGKKVQITQKPSIAEAQQSEGRIIARSKPRHNKRGT